MKYFLIPWIHLGSTAVPNLMKVTQMMNIIFNS